MGCWGENWENNRSIWWYLVLQLKPQVLAKVSDTDPHAQMRSRIDHQLRQWSVGDPGTAIYVSYLGIYHDISPLLFPRQLIQLSLGIKSGKESKYFRCSFQMSHVLTLRSGKPQFPTGWKAKWSLSCSNWFAKFGHWCPGREHSRIRRSETDLLTSSMEDGWVVYWCTEASQGFPSSNHLLLNSFHQLAF